jgi:very-short-patch-repair endonuclease
LTITNTTKFKAPPPTKAELKLRSILNSKNLLFKPGHVIWYTNCHKYTPDLIIGKRLIIEVDGKIHDANFIKTPDRIRQRALENMGFHVMRFKNKKIQSHPAIVAEEIIQKYYEIVDFDNNSKKPLVTAIKEPEESKEITESKSLIKWTKLYNENINEGNKTITLTNFKNVLEKLNPELLKNECTLDQIILNLIGLNLHIDQNNVIDFESSAKLLETHVGIMKELFPTSSRNKEKNGSEVFLKNMFNISAPNFFKNLIFNGGPRIKRHMISIKDVETLESNIDCFNNHFEKLGIQVDPHDIKVECNATLTGRKNLGYNNSDFNWLEDWIKK